MFCEYGSRLFLVKTLWNRKTSVHVLCQVLYSAALSSSGNHWVPCSEGLAALRYEVPLSCSKLPTCPHWWWNVVCSKNEKGDFALKLLALSKYNLQWFSVPIRLLSEPRHSKLSVLRKTEVNQKRRTKLLIQLVSNLVYMSLHQVNKQITLLKHKWHHDSFIYLHIEQCFKQKR